MSRLKTDHNQLKKQAVELWKQSLELKRQFTQIDREITNLKNAWAGDDELHFFVHWQEEKGENALLQQTVRAITATSEHLLQAARIYRDAQIDSVNAALELVR